MQLDELVGALDAYFRTDLVSDDDWSRAFEHAYGPDDYWRGFVEPGYAGRWTGLMVRGDAVVERAVTCVFPGDDVIAALEPRTLLFSEHPLDFADRPGFLPLARSSFDTLRQRGCSLYHVHAPLDQHAEIAPSLLLARGIGLERIETYYPIDPELPGGAAAVGVSSATVDGLADRIRAFLGDDIPVHVLTRTDERAGTVAVAAGGGADADVLRASLERGCTTYVTGNAATNCVVPRVRESVQAFRELADAEHVSLIDATHYGSERPPQHAMVKWFRRRGLPASFAENGPK